MRINSYGITNQQQLSTEADYIIEEIKLNGFSIIKNVLPKNILIKTRKALDKLNQVQKKEFGEKNLIKINDLNMVRCPLCYDGFFLENIAANKKILKIVEQILGSYYVLHLQNGIINTPDEEHHQSSWHRDLPYQNFVISSPLAISALFCIDDFNAKTGATYVVPHSHQQATVPSQRYIEKHSVQVNAEAGSVIIFDSMLLHKAGANTSVKIRRGINNIYTVPILKQQINIPAALKNKYTTNSFMYKFLGYDSDVPLSVNDWRTKRMNKMLK